jgi:hypothetical protein
MAVDSASRISSFASRAVARLHPVLRVEQLALCPHGDDAHRPQQRGKHEEDDHAGALHGAIVASSG